VEKCEISSLNSTYYILVFRQLSTEIHLQDKILKILEKRFWRSKSTAKKAYTQVKDFKNLKKSSQKSKKKI
jgi:hypothetical protein